MFRKLIFLSAIFFTVALAQTNAPKISVQPEEYNFGSIAQGDTVSHSFEIYNKGNGELRIVNVRASCGCTAATPAETNLQPGDSTELTVVFNSNGKMGTQNKIVYIKSNDPSNTVYSIKFNGNVVSDKSLLGENPKIYFPEITHDFGKVENGKVVDYIFKFVNQGNSVLNIQDIKTSCGCTAALVSSKTVKPGEDGTIKVELNTKGHTGKMVRTVTVKSNDPKAPTSTLTIFAEVVKG
ncbi:MAG: DUF1573 domain-containing protein [Ignavibacteriaceae bacterium]